MNIGIVTIFDNNNYGNKLQCFALQKKLISMGANVTVIHDEDKRLSIKIKRRIKKFFERKEKSNVEELKRKKYDEFNMKINYSKYTVDFAHPRIKEKFDYFIVGSDQVWNPNFNRLNNLDVLRFTESNKRISYAASFGVNDVPEAYQKRITKEISKFKAISVREDRGKEIIERYTRRKDVYVLIDPTMLLSSKDWEELLVKPARTPNRRYILTYFLGGISENIGNEINRVARENDCEIVNVLDMNTPFYPIGPSEFLWLEKNAFLICTDSFHSIVFAMLFNKPFVVFERSGVKESMNSRIETLISKFKLKNSQYNDKYITKENLKHDYTEAYRILEEERKKSDEFLRRALNIEKQ